MSYPDLSVDDLPSTQMLSPIYNSDSGVCSWEDHFYRRQLNASVKRAAYKFDHATKSLLCKRPC